MTPSIEKTGQLKRTNAQKEFEARALAGSTYFIGVALNAGLDGNEPILWRFISGAAGGAEGVE